MEKTTKKVGRPVKTSKTEQKESLLPGELWALAQAINFFQKRTWLTSESFLKRSFAVFGYFMSAYAVVLLGLMVFVALFQAVFE